MTKFKNCKLELDLEAQSPLIHFQSGQNGATLRASEMKPKLDRFLLNKLSKTEKMTISELKKDGRYKDIFIDQEHNALNYKVKIVSTTKPQVIVLENKENDRAEFYSIFYANSGKRSWEKKIRALYSNPRITILSFNEKVRQLIEQYIVEFFLVTNFGTMQGKGFGSFLPVKECGYRNKLDESDMKKIAGYLKQQTGSHKCYCMEFAEVPGTKDLSENNRYRRRMFEEIKSFYGIMKSGYNFRGDYARSFIYTYMHEKEDINNEKAWMKQNGIAPIKSTKGKKVSPMRKDEDSRYVRAFLGTGTTITYNPFSKEEKVSITVKSQAGLDRVSSPIFFKVIKNVVFITAYDVPEELFDTEYEFSSKMGHGKIRTPEQGKFDIHDFLASYVRYYNENLRGEVPKLKVKRKVGEVRE